MVAATPPSALPVVSVLPALREALADHGAAILRAPPGSGKTTRVPIALLDESWLRDRRIVMLEPRRLATRAAAAYMARLLGCAVGDVVGFRVRGESRMGPATRIEVVTEGVLTRRMQDDPGLDDVGLLIFDEFHERSLHADLALTLALESKAVLRPDLRILAMSATLEVEPVARILDDAPVLHAEGRSHPVRICWRNPERGASTPQHGAPGRRAAPILDASVASTVWRALDEQEGDVLVFLPGAAEIRRVEARLAETGLPPGVDVRPLHGSMPLAAQDVAIAVSPPGRRKVVLATSIAETSLTIEGVRAVVDSGLARVSRFSPRTGLARLATVNVTRASAEQRCGRAGRVAPGTCYRLWSEAEHSSLLERALPEILDADLTGLALELAVWGSTAESLRWIDPPPAAALAQAAELLRELDALDADRSVTTHGRRMAELPVHPRLAHMLLRARGLGAEPLACDIAALLDSRDPVRGDPGGAPDVDLRNRLDALAQLRKHRRVAGRFDAAALRRIDAEARRLAGRGARPGSRAHHRTRDTSDGAAGDLTGVLLAFACPDRIAMRRTGVRGRFLMRNGSGAALPPESPLAGEPFIVVADVDAAGRNARVHRAAALREADLRAHFGNAIGWEESVEWDDDDAVVATKRRERLGALVLREAELRDADPDAIAEALLEGIRRSGLDALPWNRDANVLRQRIAFLRSIDPAWPDLGERALAAGLDVWLRPHVRGIRRPSDIQPGTLTAALHAMLSWEQLRDLDRLAPTHHVVPTGSRLPIDYSDSASPALAVRLQEMLGEAETPRIAGGAVPLTLHLLSPAHRPVQVTRDLAGFWKSSYAEVRKEMRGRYPKHAWPEDPLSAEPTRRAKPRKPTA